MLHLRLSLRSDAICQKSQLSCGTFCTVVLQYLILKWHTYSTNPLWQRFDVYVYTKEAQERILEDIKNLDADIKVLKQSIKARPGNNVFIVVKGYGVIPMNRNQFKHKFTAPTIGEEFQRNFSVYFNREPDAEDPIKVLFSIVAGNDNIQTNALFFDWHEKYKSPMMTQKLYFTRGIGIQNNEYRRNVTSPDLPMEERMAIKKDMEIPNSMLQHALPGVTGSLCGSTSESEENGSGSFSNSEEYSDDTGLTLRADSQAMPKSMMTNEECYTADITIPKLVHDSTEDKPRSEDLLQNAMNSMDIEKKGNQDEDKMDTLSGAKSIEESWCTDISEDAIPNPD